MIPSLKAHAENAELEERVRVHAMYNVLSERMKHKMEEVSY